MRGTKLLTVGVLAAVAVFGLSIDAAQAQNRAKSYEWTAFGGGSIFDSELDLSDAFYFGTRFGINFSRHYELEFSAGFADTRHQVEPFKGDTDLFEVGTNMNFNFPGRTDVTWRWVPYLTAGLGLSSYDFQDAMSEQETHFSYGGGFRWFGTEKVGLRVEARGVSELGGDWTNVQLTAGLSFVSGGELRDSDGDTVPDSKDDCPNTPMGCRVDQRGCPRDADGDGVCQGLDQCPDTRVGCSVNTSGCALDEDGDGVCDGRDDCPGTQSGCEVNADGCPRDADGDGVCDGVDQCVRTPSGCRVDRNGCQADGDGDGVCDGVDRCPDTPQGCVVDARGCSRDEDGDGVCDGVDECPGTPRGVDVDEVGCELELRINNVQFDFDKAVVKPEFVPILQKVAKALSDNPRMRIALHGHTDSISTDAYNLRLSQKRADAVKRWLVDKGGISANRLETVAHGECCPIASNQTADGRYKNRRVEFKRIR